MPPPLVKRPAGRP